MSKSFTITDLTADDMVSLITAISHKKEFGLADQLTEQFMSQIHADEAAVTETPPAKEPEKAPAKSAKKTTRPRKKKTETAPASPAIPEAPQLATQSNTPTIGFPPAPTTPIIV